MKTLFDNIDRIQKYKVLTLWQPWATLLAIGAKKIETRPIFTNWTIERGTYLIHAAKKWTSELDAISKQTPFKEVLKGYPLSLGCIIGSIDVIECKPIIESNDNIILVGSKDIYVTGNELAFGDYREGRYAWICQNPKHLKTPISYSNGQGYYQNFKGDISLLNSLEYSLTMEK
jgi:hypothetical protein